MGFLGEGDRTLFSIDAIGVDISQFSAYQNESEVLLLPGTCLVVEPGVMVERNYWRFEASVWDAAQQKLQLQHGEGKPENGESDRPVWDAAQQQLQLQHGEGKPENGESERPNSGTNDGLDD